MGFSLYPIRWLILTDRKISGMPSLVVGPIPSNFLGARSAIFFGFSLSDSLVYSFLIWYTEKNIF